MSLSKPIEVGRYYITRQGDIVGPAKESRGNGEYAFAFGNRTYTRWGRYNVNVSGHMFDLVSMVEPAFQATQVTDWLTEMPTEQAGGWVLNIKEQKAYKAIFGLKAITSDKRYGYYFTETSCKLIDKSDEGFLRFATHNLQPPEIRQMFKTPTADDIGKVWEIGSFVKGANDSLLESPGFSEDYNLRNIDVKDSGPGKGFFTDEGVRKFIIEKSPGEFVAGKFGRTAA